MRLVSAAQFVSKVRNAGKRYAGHQLFDQASVPTSTRANDLRWERSDIGWATGRKATPTSRDIPWAKANEPFVRRQQTLFDPGKYGRPEDDDMTLRTRQQLFRQGWGE